MEDPEEIHPLLIPYSSPEHPRRKVCNADSDASESYNPTLPMMAKTKPTVTGGQGDSNETSNDIPVSGLLKSRILVAFWLLGMCNNYIYVIMLSAAHDVISKVEQKVGSQILHASANPIIQAKAISLRLHLFFIIEIVASYVIFKENVTNATIPQNFTRECNTLSTGAILLADILPTLFVKLVCPFLPFLVNVRVGFAVSTGVLALVLVAFADSIAVALTGVAFASFNSGLGEITLLAYSSMFPLFAIAAWSSGTGGAGIFGSFAYAGMTQGGLTPETTLLVSVIFPILFAVAFWLILKHPSKSNDSSDEEVISGSSSVSVNSEAEKNPIEFSHKLRRAIAKFLEEFKYIPKLLPYMIPVGLVYFFEYLINSGLFELLHFENTSLDRKSQFRWYNVLYQVGVFISRSSVSWIHFEKVWMMAVLQALNVVLLVSDAIYGFIPNIWIMFILIFWEGLLGGAAYVNTFYRLSYEVPEDKRLFALSIASVADTIGIVIAGLVSFPVHDAICNVPYDPIYRWP